VSFISKLQLFCAFFASQGVTSFEVCAEEPMPAEAPSAHFIVPSGSVPTEIFGNKCVKRAGDANFAPMLSCKANNVAEHPSISVSVVQNKCDKTQEQMIVASRNQYNDGTPFFKVVSEVSFVSETAPDEVGFRAFYQTSLGNRYVWHVCGNGKLTRVLAQIFSPTDNDALANEIEDKVFGIITVRELPHMEPNK
jgi:hypothetical protein